MEWEYLYETSLQWVRRIMLSISSCPATQGKGYFMDSRPRMENTYTKATAHLDRTHQMGKTTHWTSESWGSLWQHNRAYTDRFWTLFWNFLKLWYLFQVKEVAWGIGKEKEKGHNKYKFSFDLWTSLSLFVPQDLGKLCPKLEFSPYVRDEPCPSVCLQYHHRTWHPLGILHIFVKLMYNDL